MGTWGSGNFENDTAGDFFLSLIDKMTGDIRERIDTPPESAGNRGWSDIVPCLVEIITVLGRQDFHCLCLDPEEIKKWKRIFMQRWAETVADTFFEEDHRREREQILGDTFDKLIALAEKE